MDLFNLFDALANHLMKLPMAGNRDPTLGEYMNKTFNMSVRSSTLFLIIFFISTGCSSLPERSGRVPKLCDSSYITTNKKNVTADFEQFWAGGKKNSFFEIGSKDLNYLEENYQILFVKGFLSDAVGELEGEYFSDQLNWLKDTKVKNHRVDGTEVDVDGKNLKWDSEQLPMKNAQYLRWKIKTLYELEKKKVIIISHSKGGLDTLATLVAGFDKAGQKDVESGLALLGEEVAGWISIQAPFGGTQIADQLGHSSVIRHLLKTKLNGSEDALKNMSEDQRLKYMSMIDDELEKLRIGITFLSFASWKDLNVEPGELSALWPARDLILALPGNKVNDGLVPAESAILKNSHGTIGHFICKEGFDHAVPVMPADMLPNIDFAKLEKELPSLEGPIEAISSLARELEVDGAQNYQELLKDIERIPFTKALLKIWLDIERSKITN